MSSFYRALHPMPPHEVRAMTPSEVAAVLGLDLQDVIRAVPFDEKAWPAFVTPPAEANPAPQQIRRML